MNNRIEYLPVNEQHIDEAVKIAIGATAREREFIPFLPGNDSRDYFYHTIKHLFSEGNGVAALYQNRLAAFLAGFKVDEFHGTNPGIYCPIYGHGSIRENRIEIYRSLYQRAATLWLEKGLRTHAITVFTHDQDLVDTFFWQGFGLRCIDAIRKTSNIDVQSSTVRIEESTVEDAEKLANIHTRANQYYRKSPMFMHRKDTDEILKHIDWLTGYRRHEWVAYRNDIPVGFLKIAPSEETFFSAYPSVMNIKGLYVIENEREKGVGTVLLNTIQKWFIQNNIPLCGVEFESINTLGSRFWMKYFTPYTYSLVRKIDERI